MHADPIVDAGRYFDAVYAESDAIARSDYLESQAVNKITHAIRLASRAGLLSPANVRQVLETLACEMKLSGFCDADIEMTETLSESIG